MMYIYKKQIKKKSKLFQIVLFSFHLYLKLIIGQEGLKKWKFLYN
jgi:hypothetical protein